MIIKILKSSVALLAFVVGIGLTGHWALKHPTAAVAEVKIPDTTQPEEPRNPKEPQVLELVFVIDTTGSMGGLIEGAKQRVWRIINEAMQDDYHPDVRVGLVAYRDRGDQYVTRVTPLTSDLDRVYSTLLDFRAEGGGDFPEDVKRGLVDGIERAGWSRSNGNVTKVLFLVGDAPPHDNYRDESSLSAIVSDAVQHHIIINSIQCGNSPDTARVWREIAQTGYGEYFPIPQDGGVMQVSTPYDDRMAALSAKLGSTYLAYGGSRADMQARMEANSANEARMSAAATPVAASADRAVNKAINRNSYDGDLIQDIENGKTNLENVKEQELPDDLRSFKPAERKAEIERRIAERKKLREEILSLTAQREKYLKEHSAKDGKSNSFDAAVSSALKKQMNKK